MDYGIRLVFTVGEAEGFLRPVLWTSGNGPWTRQDLRLALVILRLIGNNTTGKWHLERSSVVVIKKASGERKSLHRYRKGHLHKLDL
jgi:hypothetical protein